MHVCLYIIVYMYTGKVRVREERSYSLFRELGCCCCYFTMGITDTGGQQKAEDGGVTIEASEPIPDGGIPDRPQTMLLVTGNAFNLWGSIASALVKEGIKVIKHIYLSLLHTKHKGEHIENSKN